MSGEKMVNVRVSEELHRQAVAASRRRGVSLTHVVKAALIAFALEAGTRPASVVYADKVKRK
jgi:predicted HicB family RNase H-like nuclease